MDETSQVRPDTAQTGELPSFHIDAGSIPEAYYEALKVVHFGGHTIRTQYDRRSSDGAYIDPPGKDARVSIRIRNPFSQPRFPALSYCERGKYIAEFLGAKDHLVVPYRDLLRMVREGEEFEAKQWPYCYHQRLAAYPRSDGTTMDQLELILDKLAKDSITRRATATTRVPEIDLFMASDMPCLGEVQLRAVEDGQGKLVLHLHAMWRSRDLYKAWGDNLIGIYGQDYKSKGMDKFFTRFPTCESFVQRARTSESLCELEIVPQLEDLLTETTWNFPPAASELIRGLIDDFRTGRFMP